jgi:anti-sigma regulatory factor (Ser/Thr protein kinase)
VNATLIAQAAGDLRWLRVEDASAAAACRGAALTLAHRLEFPAARADQVVLAVTEAATNLHKYASQGAMLLRIGRDTGKPAIEMVTIDAGPGFDTSAAVRDGHSTSGTLGIGLGTIRRLADSCELYSAPGHGAVLVARFRAEPTAGTVRHAGLVRPITGENECGDVFGVAERDGRVIGVLCDGLGHGPLAAAAAMEAVTAVLEEPMAEPAVLIERAHRRMGRTRGGALAVVQIVGSAVAFGGIGNIAGVILADGTRKSMISVPGIAGHQAGTIRQFEYTALPGAAVILHSDGVSGRWDPRLLPALNTRDPLVVAAALLAKAGTRRDDAGLLVLKP